MKMHMLISNPLYTSDFLQGEMPHNAVFHQSLQSLLRQIKYLQRKKYNILYTMKHPEFIISNKKE